MREDREKATGELLAIIHRDGGHYQDEHGTVRALQDAANIVTKLRTKLDRVLYHKDDPITRTRKCEDCGGTGVISILADSQLREYKPRKLETCPSCHDGEIVEQWMVVEETIHPVHKRAVANHVEGTDINFSGATVYKYIPATHGNAHEHMGKAGEWRAIEKAL